MSGLKECTKRTPTAPHSLLIIPLILIVWPFGGAWRPKSWAPMAMPPAPPYEA